MSVKESKAERELNEDPYRVLGYGVNSFFDIMFNLAVLMTVITIFLIPVFYMYSQNE